MSDDRLDAAITLHVIDMRVDYQATCLSCDWSYCGTERDLAADGHTLRLEVEQRREQVAERDARIAAAAVDIAFALIGDPGHPPALAALEHAHAVLVRAADPVAGSAVPTEADDG